MKLIVSVAVGSAFAGAQAANVLFDVQDVMLTPAGFSSYCQNSSGQIAYSAPNSDGYLRNYLWDSGNITDLSFGMFTGNAPTVRMLNNSGGFGLSDSTSTYYGNASGALYTVATNYFDGVNQYSYGPRFLTDDGILIVSSSAFNLHLFRSFSTVMGWSPLMGLYSIRSGSASSVSNEGRVAVIYSSQGSTSSTLVNVDGTSPTSYGSVSLGVTPNGILYKNSSAGTFKQVPGGDWQSCAQQYDLSDITDAGWRLDSATTFWDDTVGARPLQGLMRTAGWTLTSAGSMNANGRILARASYAGQEHLVLLNPSLVPEPQEFLTLAFGLGFVVVRKRCRRA